MYLFGKTPGATNIFAAVRCKMYTQEHLRTIADISLSSQRDFNARDFFDWQIQSGHD